MAKVEREIWAETIFNAASDGRIDIDFGAIDRMIRGVYAEIVKIESRLTSLEKRMEKE